jgi:hypothetical protein
VCIFYVKENIIYLSQRLCNCKQVVQTVYLQRKLLRLQKKFFQPTKIKVDNSASKSSLWDIKLFEVS